ncbi:MAG: hypothetical protein GX160_00340 [Clostridiales bacterium]|nr:hypothetical protein [Clostridiales bacterium]
MKKFLLIIFLLIGIISSGCTKIAVPPRDKTDGLKPTEYESVNDLEGVIMTVKEDSVSSTGLVVIFENDLQKECIYSESFLLEEKINDKWYQVPVVIEGDYGFDDVAYPLNLGDKGEWQVNWEWLYGSLDKGEYRIIKDILNFKEKGEFDTHYLAAEFTIE